MRYVGGLGALLIGLLWSSYFWIPWVGPGVYLSPDETANAVVAERIASGSSAHLEDDLLTIFPWLHPRSFVTHQIPLFGKEGVGGVLVPVGFLGLPWVVSLFRFLFGPIALVVFTPLLLISTIIPLRRLLRSWTPAARWSALVLWFSFPSVVLYANRGLFPNLAVLCLGIWAVELFRYQERKKKIFASGVLLGLAVAIRPTELLWLAPWMIYGKNWELGIGNWGQGTVKMQCVMFLSGFLLAVLPIFFFAWQVYGSAFMIGYWLHDPAIQATTSAVEAVVRKSWLPFGFHPRNIWFNVQAYLLGFLWPWAVVFVAAGVSLVRQRRWEILLVSSWTILVLLLIYGEGIYQDHVGINIVSMGNSFLRYLLPFGFLAAMAGGWLVEQISAWKPRASLLAVGGVIAIAVFGMYLSFFHDAEGVMASRKELQRYQQIRQEAVQKLSSETIVLSARSDKIFFPNFWVGTPLPDWSEVRRLVKTTSRPVAWFTETLTAPQRSMLTQQTLEANEVFSSQHQTLYVLHEISP